MSLIDIMFCLDHSASPCISHGERKALKAAKEFLEKFLGELEEEKSEEQDRA